MPAAPVLEVPAFQIKELSGKKRTVALRTRGLPIGPLQLEGEQRVKITNPPGNPEGWGNVMGPTEGTTEIQGFWKDKYIGDDSQGGPSCIEMTQPWSRSTPTISGRTSGTGGSHVTSCVDAARLFDSIRREGQLLEVTWGYIIRRGYITKFTQKWHNIHDLEWTIAFSWVSQAISNQSPLFGPPAGTLEAGSALRQALRTFARALDAPNQLVGGFMDDLRNTVNRINQFSIVFDDAATAFSDQFSVRELSSRIQSTLGSVVVTADNIKTSVESNGWSQLFTSPQRLLPFSDYLADPEEPDDTAALEAIDPVEVLKMQVYERETISDAHRLRDEAIIRQRALDDGPSRVLGTYRAREGEDLRDVSRQYYGTPTQWREIMIYNGMTTTELYAGQLVAIPNIQVQSEDV